ncbi:hypothetical protein [Deinococcus planocerae]|uniref:hypothetical protein n=1 Tax=Deinococcus planocerae TaxID=1737569 RepID=UPI000C7EA2AC|nr:hypothetical protein [Deinococcus planocerae]
MTPTQAQARILTALREGAELVIHTRQTGRGPSSTLGGRRLSVVILKELEAQKWIVREGGPGHTRARYALTPAGEATLAAWETARE